MCAERQAMILDNGAALVRPGGRLVYSTCTFAPEENEEAVAAFLARHPDFYPEEVEAPWFTPSDKGSFRLWPHKLLGEGHFAAVLRKVGEADVLSVQSQTQKLPAAWTDFAKELGITLPAGNLVQFGQSLYWAPPETPSLQGLRVLRPGLELGELKKDRFEPAHALALWLSDAAKTQDYPWDSKEMAAYIHGETVSSTVRGWCLVTVSGYSIGWGKGDGRILKNHYPKGLRR